MHNLYQLKYFLKIAISCFLVASTLSACSSPQATSLSSSTVENKAETEPSLELYPVEVDDQWGYIDATGEIVIKPQFYQVRSFSGGLAPFNQELEGKWGYIDTTGKIAITPQFDSVRNFSEGMAGIIIDDKLGYINKVGGLVVPPQFDPVYSGNFSDGLAAVKLEQGDMGYINKAGEMVIPATIFIAEDFQEGLALIDGREGAPTWIGFIDKRGKPAFRFSRKITSIPSGFDEGLAPIVTDQGRGYMDKRGRIVIEPQFYVVRKFSEGLAQVKTGSVPASMAQYLTEGKWGYIDKIGEMVIKAEFAETQPFSEGLAGVSKDGNLWGYIDKIGEIAIPMKFNYGDPFQGELARACLRVSNCGYINKKGEFVWRDP
ncbi:MAG: WG repeat-containing protein [Spirulinaceae cyanobacterium]